MYQPDQRTEMTARKQLEDRVAGVERKTQCLMLFLAGLITVVLVAAGVGPTSRDVLQATSFELVDSEGIVRAAIEMRDGFPAISLRDQRRGERVLITSTNSETAVFIKDSTGTIRLGMAQFAHGGGGFAAHGPESKGAAVLYLKGRGSLSFIDADGNVVMRLPETE